MKVNKLINQLEIKYRNKLQYYQDLLNIAEDQAEIIEQLTVEDEEGLDDLEGVIAQKEELIDKIGEVDKSLGEIRNQLVNNYKFSPENWLRELLDSRFSTVKLSKVVNKLIKKINQLQKVNQQNIKLIQTKSTRLSEKINQLKKGAKVHQSYNNPQVRVHSTYIDDKS